MFYPFHIIPFHLLIAFEGGDFGLPESWLDPNEGGTAAGGERHSQCAVGF